jgi:hypothetical protein
MSSKYIDFMREYMDLTGRTFGFACSHLMELPSKHNIMFFSHALDIATQGRLLEESITVTYLEGYSTYTMTSMLVSNVSLSVTIAGDTHAWIQDDTDLSKPYDPINIPTDRDAMFEPMMIRIANTFMLYLRAKLLSTPVETERSLLYHAHDALHIK